MLQAMGFTREQCIKALKNTDNNTERAADWIFSHLDELNAEETPSAATSALSEPTFSDGEPGRITIIIEVEAKLS